MTLLATKNITKVYGEKPHQTVALKNVNISIKAGEFTAIVGPSGSGKSTLMNILGCLDTPSEGTYYLDGQEISRLNQNQLAAIRNQKIGFIFQNFNLLERTSALKNVTLPLIYSSIDKNQRDKKAKIALNSVGLNNKLESHPNQLSGGQQQRVAIARALVTDPQIILADEPTGNLDTKTGRQIINILKNLNRLGKTIIIITHDKNVAKSAQRIITLKDGKVMHGS